MERLPEPTADGAATTDARIAETKDPGQRSRLIQAIAGMARDLVVDVIGAALGKVMTG